MKTASAIRVARAYMMKEADFFEGQNMTSNAARVVLTKLLRKIDPNVSNPENWFFKKILYDDGPALGYLESRLSLMGLGMTERSLMALLGPEITAWSSGEVDPADLIRNLLKVFMTYYRSHRKEFTVEI